MIKTQTYTHTYTFFIRIEKSPFSRLEKGKARLIVLQPTIRNYKDAKIKQGTKDQETKIT
jgi:hypothetical protein